MENLKNTSIIFFDGKCNLCNSSVNFIIKRDVDAYFKFSPLTSNFSKDFLMDKKIDFQQSNTIILYENEKIYIKSDAILSVFKNLNFPYQQLYYLKYIPKPIRDIIYDIFAKNRYKWFGKKSICMIPSAENWSRFL
ncbi:MAG: DCC1-like thiol-disulfide oxidoreductase family protein [Flavobacteriaceae bacterium]|nr:DCC1-like thiol-disulfide oxidoreductase family protein [Flavobacteriaceae bacterium]